MGFVQESSFCAQWGIGSTAQERAIVNDRNAHSESVVVKKKNNIFKATFYDCSS